MQVIIRLTNWLITSVTVKRLIRVACLGAWVAGFSQGATYDGFEDETVGTSDLIPEFKRRWRREVFEIHGNPIVGLELCIGKWRLGESPRRALACFYRNNNFCWLATSSPPPDARPLLWGLYLYYWCQVIAIVPLAPSAILLIWLMACLKQSHLPLKTIVNTWI